MKKIICFLLVFSLLVCSVGAVEVYEVEPDTQPMTFSKFAMRSVSALADTGPVLLYGSDVLSIMQPGFSTMAGVVKVDHPSQNIGGAIYPGWDEYRAQPLNGVSVSISSSSSSVTDTRIISSSSINLESNLNGGQYSGFYGICTDPRSYPVSDVELGTFAIVPDYFPISLDLSQFGDFYAFSINGLLTAQADYRDLDTGSYYDLSKATNCRLYVNDILVETFYADDNGTFDFSYYEYDTDQLITSIVLNFQCPITQQVSDTAKNIVGRFILQSDQASEIQFFSDIGLKTYRQSVLDYLSGLVLPSGNYYLDTWGDMFVSDRELPFISVFNSSVLGLYNNSILHPGSNFLGVSGDVEVTSSRMSLAYSVASSLLGVRSLIAGSASENQYTGISINNENLSSSFTETGLGPMLHTWLGDIQNDLGVLSYVFASPQDLELKKESESNMDAVGETILSSDSKSSVKVKDITSISSASDSIQELGETGVTPGQAFEQLGNSDLFSFFSAETAANLDATVSTYSHDPSRQIVTSYYQDNRLEFFDVIGKGVGW